ncbi:MAG: DUF1573 domain-containing protein [Negativicutes bacterium]|nr:DUF1573 domain-containing protein [Negativicutes bacterium]
MNNHCCLEFQAAVDKYLVRHRSVLDILTKYQEAGARVNRAFAKAVTECGCVQVHASKQEVPTDARYSELRHYMSNHTSGELCPHCREVISRELGRSMFYLTALCNLTGLDLHQVMRQECKTVTTLGFYHLS